MESKPKVYFVLGGPGAGKGTQSSHLVKEFGFVHLSAGDLLRAERNSGSEHGELIETNIREGKIVPSHITVMLLHKAMLAAGLDKSFLIDGFPRNEENFQQWMAQLGDKVEFKALLFFDCSEETMLARILKRSEQSNRSDDNVESIKKRFATYQAETKPIIDHFATLKQVIIVNAEGAEEEVRDSLFAKLKSN